MSVVSDSVRPYRWQPTRLRHPWDSPGKNTGVGCHFLLQCMKVKSHSEVAQSCPTLSDPMDCSPPGFSIHGIFQARVLEGAAIFFFRGFPTQGSNLGLLHLRQTLYCLRHQGSFSGGINPVKSQKVNILGSQGPMVSTVTTQLCHCR